MSEYSPFISDSEARRRRRDAEQAEMLRRYGMIGATAGPAIGTAGGALAGGIIGTLAGGNTIPGIGIGSGIGGTLGTVGGQLGNMFLGGQADQLTNKWDELDAKRLARAKFITENYAPYTGR